MRLIFAAIILFGLISTEAFGNCLLNESIQYNEDTKSEVEMSKASGQVVDVIIELPPLPEAPSSALPNPSDYDFNRSEEKLRYRTDRRIALIEYAQSFYEPSVTELNKIEGLRVPDKSAIGFVVVRGHYEAICKATHVRGVVSLSSDFALDIQK